MSIKRYTPRFKSLVRLKQCLWLEKSLKLKKFNKEKWQNLRRNLSFQKIKYLSQDVSSLRLSDKYITKDVFSIRLRKTYRFLLCAKQRLQKLYGMGRLKHYQLKKLALIAEQRGKTSSCSSSSFFQHLLEGRLSFSLYRASLVRSLLQGRRLVESGKVKVLEEKVGSAFAIFPKDKLLSIDFLKVYDLQDQFLKFRLPLFYSRSREERRKSMFKKKQQARLTLLSTNRIFILTHYKNNLETLIYGKKIKRFLW